MYLSKPLEYFKITPEMEERFRVYRHFFIRTNPSESSSVPEREAAVKHGEVRRSKPRDMDTTLPWTFYVIQHLSSLGLI